MKGEAEELEELEAWSGCCVTDSSGQDKDSWPPAHMSVCTRLTQEVSSEHAKVDGDKFHKDPFTDHIEQV